MGEDVIRRPLSARSALNGHQPAAFSTPCPSLRSPRLKASLIQSPENLTKPRPQTTRGLGMHFGSWPEVETFALNDTWPLADRRLLLGSALYNKGKGDFLARREFQGSRKDPMVLIVPGDGSG